jgi:hypothetical protein
LLEDGYRMGGGVGWVAPIGLPTPLWNGTCPIDISRPTLPSPWTSNTTGWYFVQSGGTNSGNGYPGSPRGTFPTPSPGEKVVFNGTWTTQPTISWTGTAANPIWLMAYNTSTKPSFGSPGAFGGAYTIIDNIAWAFNNSRDSVDIAGSNLLLRVCSYANTYDSANGAGFFPEGTNNIIYGSTISACGNWEYTGGSDIDRHGMKIGGVNGFWAVDNTIYHCHGDGIQVGDANNTAAEINKVYIGRNLFYENYQTGAWTKNATDVIFSENTCHDFWAHADSTGSGLGGQYDPKYVWYIVNSIYNCMSAVHIGGPNNGTGGPWYIIGNCASNIDAESTNYAYDAGALGGRNAGAMTIIFNTVYDADCFISTAPGHSSFRVYNNIFSTLKSGGVAFDLAGVAITHDYNCFSSSAYDPGSEANRRVGDPLFVAPASRNFALQSGSPAKDTANPVEEAAFAAFQTRYGLDIRKDILGGTRPYNSRWDMGAYEYGATSGSTPPTGIPILSVR